MNEVEIFKNKDFGEVLIKWKQSLTRLFRKDIKLWR